MRSSAPDILLTNYKMLDQMLLRAADAKIWAQSAHSLQYLVLDEFHTYDGAQGTDVAMLLRRLGLTLKAHGATGERPLGNITPVATSATLGDRGDPAAMLGFAETVFGESFSPDAVVTESRVTVDEWIGAEPLPGELAALEGRSLRAPSVRRWPRSATIPKRTCLPRPCWGAVYDGDAGKTTAIALVKGHPLTRALLESAADAIELRVLAGVLLPDVEPEQAHRCLEAYAGMLSHVRFTEGRSLPSVEVHLWMRELTRIDREAATLPAFAWSDDGGVPLGAEASEGVEAFAGHVFPALFCRHCGRSGWGVALSPANNSDLDISDADIRRKHFGREGKFRPLLLAMGEGEQALQGDAVAENLRWFHVAQRQILSKAPEGQAAQDGSVLPVLTHVGEDANDDSRDDTCPACRQRDGIRFLGSAVATQLSVALSTLFGSTNLDPSEKKTLVFTDSVQDAAHRAGFVQARSHSLTVRSMLREAVGSQPQSLDALAERVIERAGNDADRRYRILPPDQADDRSSDRSGRAPTLAKVPQKVRTRVRKRLAFDATLEFGLQSRLGRTLELTGTVAVRGRAAPPGVMLDAARAARSTRPAGSCSCSAMTTQRLRAWVRGVLEHMRERGSIEHPWLKKLIEEDGNRSLHLAWAAALRGHAGVPDRPYRAGVPARRPGDEDQENVLDTVAGTQSWYAQWAARCLGVTAAEGGVLARLLLKRLAAADVITVTSNKAGAEVFAIAAELRGRRADRRRRRCWLASTCFGARSVRARCPGRSR